MTLVLSIDHKLSSILHHADNVIFSWVLYPFSSLFHLKFIWAVFVTILILTNFDIQFTALYGLASGIAGICTWLMKRRFKRDRPQMVQGVKKPKKFRSKEKNYAMPSGDAFQAGVFAYFLYALGVRPQIAFGFLILVCLGRVYYMCHWLLDTVVGSVSGLFIGWLQIKFIQANPWILNIFDYYLAIGYQWLHILLNKKTGQL